MANVITLVLVVIVGALAGWWLLSRYLKARGHADLASQGGGVVIGVSLSVLTVALFIQFSSASASAPRSEWSATASAAYDGDWVASSQSVSTTVYREPRLVSTAQIGSSAASDNSVTSPPSTVAKPVGHADTPNATGSVGKTAVTAKAESLQTSTKQTSSKQTSIKPEQLSKVLASISPSPSTPVVSLISPLNVTPQLRPAMQVSVVDAPVATQIAAIMQQAPSENLAASYCQYLARVTRLDREVGERFGYSPSESLQPEDTLKLRDSTYFTNTKGKRELLRYNTLVKIVARVPTNAGMTYRVAVDGKTVGTIHSYDMSWFDSADQFERYEARRKEWRSLQQQKSKRQFLRGISIEAAKRKLGDKAGECNGSTTA